MQLAHNLCMWVCVMLNLLDTIRHCIFILIVSVQVVEATRNGDVSFCKAFWSLNENSVMHVGFSYVAVVVSIAGCLN